MVACVSPVGLVVKIERLTDRRLIRAHSSAIGSDHVADKKQTFHSRMPSDCIGRPDTICSAYLMFNRQRSPEITGRRLRSEKVEFRWRFHSDTFKPTD